MSYWIGGFVAFGLVAWRMTRPEFDMRSVGAMALGWAIGAAIVLTVNAIGRRWRIRIERRRP